MLPEKANENIQNYSDSHNLLISESTNGLVHEKESMGTGMRFCDLTPIVIVGLAFDSILHPNGESASNILSNYRIQLRLYRDRTLAKRKSFRGIHRDSKKDHFLCSLNIFLARKSISRLSEVISLRSEKVLRRRNECMFDNKDRFPPDKRSFLVNNLSFLANKRSFLANKRSFLAKNFHLSVRNYGGQPRCTIPCRQSDELRNSDSG